MKHVTYTLLKCKLSVINDWIDSEGKSNQYKIQKGKQKMSCHFNIFIFYFLRWWIIVSFVGREWEKNAFASTIRCGIINIGVDVGLCALLDWRSFTSVDEERKRQGWRGSIIVVIVNARDLIFPSVIIILFFFIYYSIIHSISNWYSISLFVGRMSLIYW